jgi:poly(A) polymerase
VRDLLLRKPPKDFDIATSARPQQVKRVFPRNCRIIGRRFKLAHLHFNQNQKILEVATFRTTPVGEEESEDLLIKRDNVFGTAEEDARRRDFTVNALFFDPHDDRILDYVGGLEDLQHHRLRTIGDPVTRFREDPVRILRAAKFAGRMHFMIEQDTLAAMRLVAPELARAAPPRLLEEILRLLRGGHALDSFQILRDIAALPVILPTVGAYLEDAPADERVVFWRMLEALDARIVATGSVPGTPILLGALMLRPVLRRFDAEGRRSATLLAEEMLGPLGVDLRLPRRDAGSLKRIVGVHPRFATHGAKRFSVEAFLRDSHFAEALTLFELSCQARGEGFDDLQRWQDLAAGTTLPGPDLDADADVDADLDDDEDEGRAAQAAPAEPGRKRRRRRRRRRRGGGSEGERHDGERETPAAPAADADDRSGAAAPERSRPPGERGRRRGGRRSRRGDREQRSRPDERPRKQRSDKVATIEPEPEDLSAFDVELDPKRVPSFGAFVDRDKARRRAPVNAAADDKEPYRPPPPPDAAPPPPPPDEEFGDW